MGTTFGPLTKCEFFNGMKFYDDHTVPEFVLRLDGPSGLPKAIDSGRMCRRHFARAMRLLQGCLGSLRGCLWLWTLDSRCCRFSRAVLTHGMILSTFGYCSSSCFTLGFNKKLKRGELGYRPQQDPRFTKRPSRSPLKEPPLLGIVYTLRQFDIAVEDHMVLLVNQ